MLALSLIATVFLVHCCVAHPAENAARQAAEADAKLWAVLVAGSMNYFNYRHQADVCHAYQILKSHGIPDERIIVMMFDDIAGNVRNPNKGVLINRPGGPNVYSGVVKDYTAPDVNSYNFINILKGNAQGIHKLGDKKVLKSGPNDHVFIYFADHGAPNILGFPDTYLKASDLHATLMYMNQKKMYGKMVLYIEACNSGSLFTGTAALPSNISIYASTSANAVESSYACYYSDTYETYLGDVYSVKWMEDSDRQSIESETLQQQFSTVQQETNTSHVTEFGDLSVKKLTVGEFQGTKAAPKIDTAEPPFVSTLQSSVDSRDVPMYVWMNKLRTGAAIGDKLQALKELDDIIKKRITLVANMMAIYEQTVSASFQDSTWITTLKRPEDADACYYAAVAEYNKKCYDIVLNSYSLGYLERFRVLCDSGIKPKLIVQKIDANCKGASVIGVI